MSTNRPDADATQKLASTMMEFRQKAFDFKEPVSMREQDASLERGIKKLHKNIVLKSVELDPWLRKENSLKSPGRKGSEPATDY